MISDWTQRIGLVVHLTCFIHVDYTRELHRGRRACLCPGLGREARFWGGGGMEVCPLSSTFNNASHDVFKTFKPAMFHTRLLFGLHHLSMFLWQARLLTCGIYCTALKDVNEFWEAWRQRNNKKQNSRLQEFNQLFEIHLALLSTRHSQHYHHTQCTKHADICKVWLPLWENLMNLNFQLPPHWRRSSAQHFSN